MKLYWQKEGHVLIDNLKGESYNVDRKVAMTIVSKEIMKHLKSLDGKSY